MSVGHARHISYKHIQNTGNQSATIAQQSTKPCHGLGSGGCFPVFHEFLRFLRLQIYTFFRI